MKNRAVFLDRDGNINKDVGYPSSYDQIEIYPYSYEAVQKINRADFLAVITTNQSGIGRGLIEEAELQDIHQKMREDFARRNARIDGIFYCPHFISSQIPEYNIDCSCRKPFPDMALRAAAEMSIDLSRSYMVGDKVEDIQFGVNIEAKPILVLTGYGEKSLRILEEQGIVPAYVAKDLLAAVEWILKNEKDRDY
jgi:D-glycero-D-manno-heptose 1,7-bisphosphate phosphatase